MLNDTIAAVATPVAGGGIAIIRLSGDRALDVVKKIFKCKGKFEPKSHTITYGYIYDSHGHMIDEVLVMVMLAPRSYTAENVVEINCHGGSAVVSAVFEAILSAGARRAEPGEFTKRAFLNGRIDLSQAEAVADLINAKTKLASKLALNQLNGSVSREIDEIRERILNLTAQVDVSLDYPEYEDDFGNLSFVKEEASVLLATIQKMLKNYEDGKIIREGLTAAILGSPNVGKSSLLNALLSEERAIVTDIPGTTRDVLYEYININGISVKLADTAGIRQTDEPIEKIGVERSMSQISVSDLIILVLDNSRAVNEQELELISTIRENQESKRVIVVVNKCDLPPKIELDMIRQHLPESVFINSSLKGNKVAAVEEIREAFGRLFFNSEYLEQANNQALINKARHKDALERAGAALSELLGSCFLTEDIVSLLLREAYAALGEINGDSVSIDIVDKIFEEFCVGK